MNAEHIRTNCWQCGAPLIQGVIAHVCRSAQISAADPQFRRTDDGCNFMSFYSCICSLGTKGCDIDHRTGKSIYGGR